MLNFNINLTSLAVILWSGMLIISGSIWVLASQVRKLADVFEDRERAGNAVLRPPAPAPARGSTAARARVTRGGHVVASRRNGRAESERLFG
jgi:hypothetical protein